MPGGVRMGIIGLGAMGSFHADYLREGRVRRARLTAVCDGRADRLSRFEGVSKYEDSGKLLRSGDVDAVIIATPHSSHTDVGMEAFANGVHVLMEKPISVHKADCKKLIDAYKKTKLVFSAMYQVRTSPYWQKVKQMVSTGELGELRRVNWIITDWFRSDAYYASNEWRATWRGEGGGVLLNQCQQNLDLLAWVLGMPNRVTGFCQFGRFHDIEVEDSVTAYLEYPNGATGAFVATTGEAPGSNRWEIAGNRGKLVMENNEISFFRNEVPAPDFCRTTKEMFEAPPCWFIKVPTPPGGGHHEITQDFVNAILDGTPLLVRGEEGMNAVELANAMIFSSLTGKPVEMPLDAPAYEAKLKELIAGSGRNKKVREISAPDVKSSFH
jgi:predicted dehydrogenase